MLTEHAISHAMNLNHPLLMLYSSIYYAQFEKLYETTHKVYEEIFIICSGHRISQIKEYFLD
jgi:hypothetical protein